MNETEITLMTWMNWISNFGLCVSIMLFTIFLFGRDNSVVYKWPVWRTWMLKSTLALCATAALANSITGSNTTWAASGISVGLAGLFGWAAWFHHNRFVKPWHATQSAAEKLDAAIKASKPARSAARKTAAVK